MDGNKPFFKWVDSMEYIQAKKKFGQNFLKNEEVLKTIATCANVDEQDLIIEIGPGMGALTKYLFQNKSYLFCYEIDERMKEYLKEYETERSQVIYGDFLKRNIEDDIKSFPYKDIYVIANIPYYITSPILSKLIEFPVPIKEIVLLVQKEFAERIVSESSHKEYNAFTLFVDSLYDAELISYVSKNDFIPAPKVDSAVIKLTRKEKTNIQDRNFYLQFTKDAFLNKRKTLKNNLKNYDWNRIKNLLKELGYKEAVRAEEISKEDFKKLVNQYID